MKYQTSSHRRAYRAPSGFTLIELMTTLAAGLFMLTMVVPGISGLHQNSRQTSAANSLLATLNAARDQAIQRDARLSVCQSANGTMCSNSGWEKGWILFSDGGVPGKVDKDDTILYKAPPLPDDMRLSSANFNYYISYFSDGTANTSGRFNFLNAQNYRRISSLYVSATGRATIDTEACHKNPTTCL